MSRIPAVVLAVIATGLVFSASAADPNTWWVDDANYGAAVQDGSEEHPFGTILAAVTNSACVNGDTIKVKPGVYDKDYDERTVTIKSSEYQMRTRVFIDKVVNIVATGSKEETHIVGRFCPEEEGGHATYHSGPTAVRCICVAKAGFGSTLTGFTLRDSATVQATAVESSYHCGGAIGVSGYNKDFYVTDCVISNCFSYSYGGVSYGGTFNRCLISDCAASSRAAALYGSCAVNSVIVNCQLFASGNITLAYKSDCKLVNCTIYGNKAARMGVATAAPACYNCLFVGNGSVETNGVSVHATNIYSSPGKNYCNEPNEFPLYAPYRGDYHPLAGSAAIGAGNPSHFSAVTLPAGTEIRDMDGNLIDTTAEHINAGAYQTAKVEPEHNYGAVLFAGSVGINGFPPSFAPRTLVYADSWPTTIKAYPGEDNFRLAVSGAKSTDLLSRFAGKDGYVAITPPYERGAVQTNTVESLTEIGTRYVDAVNGSDDNDGLTKTNAYKTLQKVIENGADTKNRRVIYVAEGDYNTGGGLDRGVTNRINLTKRLWLKFIATGDRDKTIIRGAAAKNELDPVKYPGCGPDAVRCVNFNYGNSSSTDEQTIAFVGFTFADGHSDVSSSPYGGAAYGRLKGTDHVQFVDCVFTNCYAKDGGVSTRAHFTRCRFIDCGGGTHAFRFSILNSCVVEKGRCGTGVFGPTVIAVNCSVADSNAIETGNDNQKILNCALGDGGSLPSSVVTWGSTAASCFADAANGDFRLVSGSPALDAARRTFPVPGDSDWNDFATYFSDFATDNIDGTPWLFSGGFPVAGAYGSWAPGVLITFDTSNYSITGAAAGANPLNPGDTVTIARSPSAVRHYGIVMNGVTNMLDSGAFVYTMPADSGMTDGVIEQVLEQNWYVNPDPTSGASDSNNGFTPDTAKLTLAGVLSVATNAGDVVNAYPGTYASGTMRHTSSAPVLARGVVWENVTLKAIGSAADTIIQGEASTHQYADKNGNGTNAVRCVYVQSGGCVQGFKLTGGRTSLGSTAQYACAGGAYLYGGALVDCEVTGNGCSYRGRAVAGQNSGALIRCYVHDQKCGTYEAYSSVSIIDSYMTGSFYGVGTVLNSTVIDDLRSSSTLRIINSYITSASTPPNSSTYKSVCTNCVFTSSEADAVSAYATYDTNTCRFSAATADNLDSNFRPKTKASPLVDFGDKALYDQWFPEKWKQFKTNRDRTGGQRIYNGQIDVGCGEYDFRGDFAAMLGQRAVISEMGPNVTTNVASNIVVPEGDAIVLSMSPLRPGREFAYDLVYTPDGGEEVAISGKSTEEFSRTLEGACTVQSFAGRSTFGCLLIYR